MKPIKVLLFYILSIGIITGQADKNIPVDTLIARANVSNKNMQYEEAITNYLLAVDVLTEKVDSSKLALVYSNIGVINAKLRNLDKAIEYLEKSLDFSLYNESLRLRTLYNISAFYYDKKNIEQCLIRSREAEKLANKSDNKLVLSAIYSTYCNVYRDLKDYTTSIEYGLKSLDLKKTLKLNPDITINNIGYSYLLKGDYRASINYLRTIENTKNKALQVLVFNNLKSAYEESNIVNEALAYSNKLIKLKDSLNEAQQDVKVASVIEKYESEKKQQQIDALQIENELKQSELKGQRNIFWGLGILGLLSSLLVFLWFKNQKTNQSYVQASLQHKLLQTQLNPHFLFHALNSIQSFIYQNKKEESSSYLVSYSKLMRSILESSDQDFITVEEDVNAMEAYIKLQQLNLPDGITIEINCDEPIKEFKIPPMFIQPYIENALIHGIGQTENGHVSVDYKDMDTRIEVSIIDNGSGVTQKQSNNELHRSMSTEIVKERIQNLKQIHRYVVQITTSPTPEGTTVLLKFPKKE